MPVQYSLLMWKMIGQFYWFAHHLIYTHCVVCLSTKRVVVLQGQRVSLCSLVAAMLQVEWRPLEETLLPLELLAAQVRPRSGFRADCKEETFLEMQRWLWMVCSTQEATGEEMDCKTQQEKLPHPTEIAREGSGFCSKQRSRVALNIFVRLWNLT